MRLPKPPVQSNDDDRADALLNTPRTKSRPPLLAPEPVDVSRAIGRQPEEWEAFLIIEARRRARAAELGILRGIR